MMTIRRLDRSGRRSRRWTNFGAAAAASLPPAVWKGVRPRRAPPQDYAGALMAITRVVLGVATRPGETERVSGASTWSGRWFRVAGDVHALRVRAVGACSIAARVDHAGGERDAHRSVGVGDILADREQASMVRKRVGDAHSYRPVGVGDVADVAAVTVGRCNAVAPVAVRCV